MDGTIINTEGVWERATEKLLHMKKVQPTPEQRALIEKQAHGLHLRQNCKILKDVLKLEEDIETLVQELTALGDQSYQQSVTFIDGFTDFHAQLSTYRLKSGVATNAVDSTVEITKKTLNLENYFGEHIYNISHVARPKPDPDIYLHTAQQLNCQPAHCVVIEDSANGIKAAKAAGMFCIGINTSKKPEALKEANFIIDSYDEISLPRLLKIK